MNSEGIGELQQELDKAKAAREHTWKWIALHYGKLEDWARNQLPEPFRTEFFNCVANGVWSSTLDNAPPYICNAGFVVRPSGYFHMKTAAEQLLFDQWKRAEDAEARIKELEAQIEKLKAPVTVDEVAAHYGDELEIDRMHEIAGIGTGLIAARSGEV